MTKTCLEEAIDFVASFYNISPEIATLYYNDEIESYLWLTTKSRSTRKYESCPDL